LIDMRGWCIALALGVASIACAGPSPDTAPASEQPAAAPASEVPAPAKAAAPPPVAPPPVAKLEPVVKLGRDHLSVVACASSADCGWDDDCLPTRCVEARAERTACDESSPPPGECLCLAGACTLQPKTPPVASGTCEIRGCVVDRAAGKCVADTGGVAENLRTTPGVNVGPSCDCPSPAKGCAFTWFPAVPCTSDRDCWIDPSPRTHPVARPKALRKRDFQPCKDGEIAPKCGDAGQCVLGPAYSC